MEGDSMSQLLCLENETFLEDEDEDEDEHTFFDFGFVKEEEGYLEMTMEKEISFNFSNLGFNRDWIKCTRLEAISCIFKSREMFGFRLPTIYLSIAYFDRFLTKKTIASEKLWAVRLLSVACLSLAAKMEEIKVPQLTQLQLIIEDCNFESEVIQGMELLVLNTLEWRMISITPFPFLHYFFIKFCNNSSIPYHILISSSVGFVLALIKEINLMGYRPSVIAAAATLMALDQSLTRNALEGRVNSISSSGLLQTEDVCQCYDIIKKLEIYDLETFTSIGIKRKRISDQDYGLPDEKRQT